jgi:hypothetical protein
MYMKETSGFNWLPMSRRRFATLAWIYRVPRFAFIGLGSLLGVFLIYAPLSLFGITDPMHLSWSLLLAPASGFAAGGTIFLYHAAAEHLRTISPAQPIRKFLWELVSFLAFPLTYIYLYALIFWQVPYATMIASYTFWPLLALGTLSFLHREAAVNGERIKKPTSVQRVMPQFLTNPATLADHLGLFVAALILFSLITTVGYWMKDKGGVFMSLLTIGTGVGVLALHRYVAYRNSLRARRALPVPFFRVWLDGVLPTLSLFLAAGIVERFAIVRFEMPFVTLWMLCFGCGSVLLAQGVMSWVRDRTVFRTIMGIAMFSLFMSTGFLGMLFQSSMPMLAIMSILLGIAGLTLQYHALRSSSDFFVVIDLKENKA